MRVSRYPGRSRVTFSAATLRPGSHTHQRGRERNYKHHKPFIYVYTLNIFKVYIKCYNRTGGSSNQSALPHMFSGAETRPGASFFFLLSQILSLRRFQSHLNETFGTQTAHFSFVCCCEATLDFRNVSTLCVLHCYTCYLTYFVQRQGGKEKKKKTSCENTDIFRQEP